MKRPFQWRRAIAPAAADAALALAGLVAYTATIGKVFGRAADLWASRPLAAAVVVGIGLLLASRSRGRRLLGRGLHRIS
jgi:hypothetical protein